MKYNVCQVVFSTNRLEYLIPTLRGQRNLNFYNCNVDRVFIDDYPKTRNNSMITELVKRYGYNEIILHEENQGLSKTWSDFYKHIAGRNYDYILHMEDDVQILEPVLITDLIEMLENNPDISQVQLARQAWYSHETDPEASPDDFIYKNFRYIKSSLIFSPMASLCRYETTQLPFNEWFSHNVNEGIIGQTLYEKYKQVSANVRNYYGKNIIRHIGEWFVGMRLRPDEPGYEHFAHFHPDRKYFSRDGKEYP